MKHEFRPDNAREFYDRFGSKQDLQGFYENPALDDLIGHADFGHARHVFELGFGTGRFAQRLLSQHLPADSRYSGIDISVTMARLAQERLAAWKDRVALKISDGSKRIDAPDGSFDRFVSTYVLDLLGPENIRSVLGAAHRVLKTNGKLCLISLTKGKSPFGRIVTWTWELIYSLRPEFVGGCRPIELLDYLAPDLWRIEYSNTVSSFGITSEIVVASPKSASC